MVKQAELVAGIKNAVVKGEPLKDAKQSFINAGYSPEDVEDSAKDLEGVISKIPEKPMPKMGKKEAKAGNLPQDPATPQTPGQPQTPATPQTPGQPLMQKPKKSKFWLILMIVALAILLVILGASFFFKDQILAMFG